MFPSYRGTKLRELFWKFWQLAILSQFFTKNGLKMAIFRPFFVKNWHKTANFQKSSLNFVPPYDGTIWCIFQLGHRGQKSQIFAGIFCWIRLTITSTGKKFFSKNLVFKTFRGHFCENGLFWSKNLKICLLYPIWCLNIVQKHLQWLSMAINDWNWYASISFDLF